MMRLSVVPHEERMIAPSPLMEEGNGDSNMARARVRDTSKPQSSSLSFPFTRPRYARPRSSTRGEGTPTSASGHVA
jgi:hypothetical protein